MNSARPRPFLVVLLLAGLCVAVPAAGQQTLGRTIRQLPPLADTLLDGQVQAILLQMDAFHADSSMRLIGEALRHVGDPGDAEARCYLLAYRAEVLYYEGLFNEAMRDLDQAEQLAFGLQDSTLIANVYNLKGLLHENIQDSREALPHLLQALHWFPSRPQARYPVSELHHIHGNLGSYLTELGRLDSAGMHLRRSLELATDAAAPRAIAVAHWSLGNLALRRGLPDSALACFDRSIAVAHAARDHDIGVDALVGRARALAEAGKRKEADVALQEALAYLDAHRAGIGLVTQRNFARVAAATWRELGDLEGAFVQLGAWHRIDSLITARNIHTALNTQAELLRSDQELELAKLEQARLDETLRAERFRQRAAIAAALGLLVLITVIYLLNSSRQRQKQRLAELEVLRLRQEGTIAELELRERLGRDMHDDLGAGLSALKLRSEMALRKETDPAQRELLRTLAGNAGDLMASMRQIIWAMNGGQASLEDLVVYTASHARTYLADSGLQAHVTSDGPWPGLQLDSETRRNVFLIVKEALHNVVKHAQAQAVQVVLRWENGLHVEVRDDGQGFSGAEGGGNGLRNMHKRAAMLGGTLEVRSEGGTAIMLRVPLGPAPNLRSIVPEAGASAPSRA